MVALQHDYKVFYITESGHAPTQKFFDILNRGVANILKEERREKAGDTIHILAHGGPEYNDPHTLAEKIGDGNENDTVLALVEKVGDDGGFKCYPFMEGMKYIQKVLSVSSGTSYEALWRMIQK